MFELTSKKTSPSVRHFTLGPLRRVQDLGSIRYPSRYRRESFKNHDSLMPGHHCETRRRRRSTAGILVYVRDSVIAIASKSESLCDAT